MTLKGFYRFITLDELYWPEDKFSQDNSLYSKIYCAQKDNDEHKSQLLANCLSSTLVGTSYAFSLYAHHANQQSLFSIESLRPEHFMMGVLSPLMGYLVISTTQAVVQLFRNRKFINQTKQDLEALTQ